MCFCLGAQSIQSGIICTGWLIVVDAILKTLIVDSLDSHGNVNIPAQTLKHAKAFPRPFLPHPLILAQQQLHTKSYQHSAVFLFRYRTTATSTVPAFHLDSPGLTSDTRWGRVEILLCSRCRPTNRYMGELLSWEPTLHETENLHNA
jgi:hypothetical protein